MKRDNDSHKKFEWDMAAVLLIVLAVVFLLFVAMAFWPLHHPSGREP